MNSLTLKTGIISGIAAIILLLIFLISIFRVPPLNFISIKEYQAEYTLRQLIPLISAFLLVLANLPLLTSVFLRADENKKVIALSGLLFVTGYIICSGAAYFVQFTIVYKNLFNGNGENVTNFIFENKLSFTAALDQLGYLFLALSMLFFSALFKLHGLEGYIKSLFVIYGISGIAGAFGYITGISFLDSMVFLSAFPYFAGIILLVILYIRELNQIHTD